MLTADIIYHKGDFTNVYERLLGVNTYASGTPTYTLFGSLLYQYENEEKPILPIQKIRSKSGSKICHRFMLFPIPFIIRKIA